jgi:hypothetical protein
MTHSLCGFIEQKDRGFSGERDGDFETPLFAVR